MTRAGCDAVFMMLRSQLFIAVHYLQSPAWPQRSGAGKSVRRKLVAGRPTIRSTGRIRIKCQAIVGSISGQDYKEFGVNEVQQSGLVKTLKPIS